MDKQIGPYKIVRLIGAGGMGSVYEALHSQIERRAAIKVLHKDFQKDTEFLQRFFNEARAVNIINHQSLVSVYDFGSAVDGSPYIVMEYLEGDSLRQRLARSGRLAPEAVMRIGKQVASGLAAAHAKHVVHRDLKPVNIMLVADTDTAEGERAKILDFGIAKLTADPSAKSLTRIGASIGTPAYMSPEQCKSAHDVSDRSDVYSLGLILFELLTGEHPFAEAKADSAMMASHIGKPPPPLGTKAPGIIPELATLVDRMLAKQPDTRPSAAEVAATLGRLTGSATGLMQVLTAPPSALLAESPSAAVRAVELPSPASRLLGALRVQLQNGKVVVIAALTTLLLGGLGLGIVVRMLLNPPPAVPVQIQWLIRSQPADAEVVDATGQVLGKTPFTYTRPRGAGIDVLSVRHDGYAEQRVAVATDHNGEQSLVLTERAKEPPPVVSDVKRAIPDPPEKQHFRKSKKDKKKKSRHGSAT